ncbi:hypothetical protein [Metabacillus fastidiosus]|uniref:hypothetical protein n=1 Tax=Metabacillus fastidiosus TaxID=1458 RepID=UPI000A59E9A9|nr:hypothetical protein [Metabacillus fastidiosus]MED4464752.1 hypothetical protein [Metabacillus fastidiosus]
MALIHAKVKIIGTKPLFFHVFTTETLSLERRERTGVAGNDPEEWKRTYTADEDGRLYVDPSYVFGCMREAAKHTKSGRGSIQSKLSATLQVLSNRVYFNSYLPEEITQDENEPVYLDIRSVRNPSTKGRNVRYRVALSSGWETEFDIVWDNTLVATHQIEAVLHDAGMLVGLADGRSIGYGRFEVLSVETQTFEEYKNSLPTQTKGKGKTKKVG